LGQDNENFLQNGKAACVMELNFDNLLAAGRTICSALGKEWGVDIDKERRAKHPHLTLRRNTANDSHELTIKVWFEVDEKERTFLRIDSSPYYLGAGFPSKDEKARLDQAVMAAESAITQVLYPIEGWR
jgi:hypothetical protein